LAEHLEVSERTIYRDIDKLSLAGIPIYAQRGKGGGIALLSDYVLDKTTLSQEEKEQILTSLQALGTSGFDEEQKSLSKLKDFFGMGTEDWIEIDFTGWGDRAAEEQRFRAIKTGILQHRYMEIEYSGMKESAVRKIKPLKLLFRAQSWYVYAYCELRGDYRYFKLKRIVKYQLLEETFLPQAVGQRENDGGTDAIDSQVESSALSDGNVSVEKSNTREKIVLQISKEMAFRVYDELDDITVLENGDLLCQMEMDKQGWFWSYIFSYGEYARVLAPENLCREMQQKIEAMKNLYTEK